MGSSKVLMDNFLTTCGHAYMNLSVWRRCQ